MTVPTNGTNGTAPANKVAQIPMPCPWHILTIVQSTFLFTSESVGEGHPDKIW